MRSLGPTLQQGHPAPLQLCQPPIVAVCHPSRVASQPLRPQVVWIVSCSEPRWVARKSSLRGTQALKGLLSILCNCGNPTLHGCSMYDQLILLKICYKNSRALSNSQALGRICVVGSRHSEVVKLSSVTSYGLEFQTFTNNLDDPNTNSLIS